MSTLPVIDRPIDNTAISTFMKCPREYRLSMMEGWRSKQKSQALSFGAFWHKLLEVHYKSGGDMDMVMLAYAQYKDSVPSDGDYRTAERALIEYKKYRKKYPPSMDCKETVGFPDAPMVEIATAVHNEQFGHEYAGKIDRIIQIGDLGYVEDHKTTSRKDKHYFTQFALSNQMKGYVWIAQQLVPGLKIVGVRINLAHILTSKSDFDRHIVTYSQSIIDEWAENTGEWLHRLKDSIRRNSFPGHFGDNGCLHKYGKCQFFDVCATNPTIRQSYLEQNFHVDHWDPLAVED